MDQDRIKLAEQHITVLQNDLIGITTEFNQVLGEFSKALGLLTRTSQTVQNSLQAQLEAVAVHMNKLQTKLETVDESVDVILDGMDPSTSDPEFANA